jgi:hypothetical protein
MIAKEDAKKRGEDWDLIPSDERTERVRKAAHDYEQQRAKGGKDDVANFSLVGMSRPVALAGRRRRHS